MTLSYDTLNLPSGEHSQDRVMVKERPGGLTLLLADGAGGVSGGAIAAAGFLEHFSTLAEVQRDSLIRQFATLDFRLEDHRQAGDTTGIVIVIEGTNSSEPRWATPEPCSWPTVENWLT